jgi:dienelactone hydrolase
MAGLSDKRLNVSNPRSSVSPPETRDESRETTRREFLKTVSAVAVPAFLAPRPAMPLPSGLQTHTRTAEVAPNMIGGYGEWAAGIVGDQPARLSFLQPRFQDPEAWRVEARERVWECLAPPDVAPVSDVRIESATESEGVQIEKVSWQLSHGPRTSAVVLKPVGARGRLPAVVGLHDHGGRKYFGLEKITRDGNAQHPMMVQHQRDYYGGAAWANELARRGYVVLVHDAFAFASRRVLMEDVAPGALQRATPVSDDSEASVTAYNTWASEHEHLMAKSLFCAGTTWPGVFLKEDQRALDYLCSRSDVDPDRVGCAGLSGGGLRTVYLGGMDDRIRCACCVGMMSTWRDYLLHKCHTHTWMIYIPLLPRDLDYPEVFALRAPAATLVQNDMEDSLFTMPEMQRADQMMRSVFEKAGAADRYRCTFHPGPHKFDLPMQQEAFDWFDRWLS